MTYILRVPQPLSSPLPNTPVLPARVLISDSFSGADMSSVIGRTTDSRHGGSVAAWEGSPNMAAIVGGALQRGAGTDGAWFVGLQGPTVDYEVSLLIVKPAAGSSIFLDARRSAAVGTGAPDAYRLTLGVNGNSMILQKRVNGTTTILVESAALPKPTAGKTCGLRLVGGVLSVIVDGAVVARHADPSPLTGSGWAGIAGTASVSSFTYDDFIIRAAG